MSSLLRVSCLTVGGLALLTTGTAFGQIVQGPGLYYQGPGTYDYVDISTVGTAAVTSNDGETDVALPWAFPFFGNNYSTVKVGGTGGVGFGGTSALYNGNADLPDLGTGSHDIAAFWDALDASDGDGAFTYDDTANGRFIINWDVETDASGVDNDLSFQMHLYPNGDIQFHYEDVVTSNSASLGAGATVGIQDMTGGTAVSASNWMEFSYNSPSLSNGLALMYGTSVDVDVDGFLAVVDCDDNDPLINPRAREVCADGIDQDCDGSDALTDVDGDGSIATVCGGDDCNDFDAAIDGLDVDGDGVSLCDLDCDDADPLAFPGAPEICDNIDQNCDGVVSDEIDNDGDGYTSCNAVTGQTPGGDCDDTNALMSPALAEVCGDGFDNNCDGNVDDVDADGDGSIGEACGGPDCDDSDAAINPDAVEVCDGADVDSDCDGISDSFDLDIGTVSSTEVLTDSSVTAIPDNDPTGLTVALVSAAVDPIIDIDVEVDITHTWDGDLDITLISPTGTSVLLSDNNGSTGDNFIDTVFDDGAATAIGNGSPPFTGSFIPDNPLSAFNGEVATGTWELLIVDSGNGDVGTLDSWTLTIETGTVGDLDGDGNVDSCGDCDAADPLIFEGAAEVCGNGIDEDCSGADDLIDADLDGENAIVCGGLDCDDNDAAINSTADVDLDGVFACDGDCDDNDDLIFTGASETACDTIDSDCDGFDGEGIDGTEDADGDGETVCAGDCDDSIASVNTTGTEACNGFDNDCDGTVGIDVDLDGVTSCGDLDCDDNDALAFPGNLEVCDGADVDGDCDGISDSFDLDTGGNGSTESFSDAPGTYIPSNLTTNVTQTIVSANDTINDVNVTIDITHTWDGDLDIFIVSPLGTRVELTTGNGSLNDNYQVTTFDDAATQTITSGSAPFNGTYQPEGLLSDLNGEDLNGIWTLEVTDTVGGDQGTINEWSLEIFGSTGPLVVTDVDGDGNVDLCGDCDDTDPLIFEGAPEDCGVTDNNCDGVITALDVDLDGENDILCAGGTDCDDGDINVNTAATELCNDAIDNDCSDLTDDLFDDDLDGDLCDTDCDDADPLVFTGGFEVCDDGIDNDCDVATLDLGDNDGDTFACDVDCDDTNPAVFTGAVEALCDFIDNDCDAATPDVGDGDGDTFGCDVDCDDSNGAINPAATEVACDGVDNDCDPLTDGEADVDLDGFTCFDDCDDSDPLVNPASAEICADTIDNDCDPLTADIHDGDLDGELCDTDCDDVDPLVFTGAPEWCNDALDQDCDGELDETVDDSYPLDNDGDVRIGLCGGTTFDMCGSTWDTFYVQSNGRVTFGYSDTDHTESVGEFNVPQIAAMWTDLDPSLNQASDIHITEDDVTGDILITFTDVAEVANAATANSFTMTLWSDDTASIDFGTNSVMDGMVGFACGDGTNGAVTQVDFSDDVLLDNQWAFGTGTEDALFEVFAEATNPNDTSDSLVDLCLTAGIDDDLDGWTDTCGDCDDADITSFPGAPELCDTIDNDCDGIADNVDLDGDTFIDVDCGGDDCDDTNEITYPGAPEQCDGLDNDCDDAPEEGSEDDDGDEVSICAGDCDDGNDTVYGGDDPAEEICDLLDNDCNGTVDDQFDTDQDGDTYQDADCGGDDCDDDEADVFPGNAEVCDQLDNDCNSTVDDVDADLDTFFSAACGGDDCDDSSADVNPGAEEVPYDEIDNDCSEGDLLDVDGDGYQASTVPGGTDCDDNDAAVNTGALENSDAEGTCSDGKDNNCDAAIDIEDELCSSCEDCNASYTGSGPMGTAQAAFALLMVLGLGLRRRRE